MTSDSAKQAPLSLPAAGDDGERLARLRPDPLRGRVGPATYLRLMGEHGAAGRGPARPCPRSRAAAGVDGTPLPEPGRWAELKAAKTGGARGMLCLATRTTRRHWRASQMRRVLLWARGRASDGAAVLALASRRNCSRWDADGAAGLGRRSGRGGSSSFGAFARGIDALAIARAGKGHHRGRRATRRVYPFRKHRSAREHRAKA